MPSPTTPPSITAAPTPAPQRNDRTTFSGRVDAFVTWISAAVAEFSAVATNAYNNAVSAFDSAVAALAYKDTATTQAGIATAQAAAASASAQTAVNAPGTSATSTTSLTIDAISKTLTIQTGKSIVPSMYVVIAQTSATSNSMVRVVNTYDAGTGALTVLAGSFEGGGTHTDWTISLTSKPAVAAGTTIAQSLLLS